MSSERFHAGPEIPKDSDMPPRTRFFYASLTMNGLRYVLILVVVMVFSNCENTDLGTIDPSGKPPFLDEGLIQPTSINIDSLSPVGGVYTFTAIVRARATDPDGSANLANVRVHLFQPGESEPVDELTLHDDGIAPDSSSSDGLYTAEVPISLLRSQAGSYVLQIQAYDREGFLSNVLLLTVKADRRNSPPYLLPSSLVAPDTVVRGVDTQVFMSIAAADSDGISDIQEVYLRNLDSPSQTKFGMFDDGGAIQQGGITSGDLLAGDGIFSIIIQIPPSISPGTFRFAFQASDTFRDTSDVFVHNLVIR
jgi:hypothetical protein